MPRGRHGGRRCRPKIKKCVHFLWRPVSKNVKLCESARRISAFRAFRARANLATGAGRGIAGARARVHRRAYAARAREEAGLTTPFASRDLERAARRPPGAGGEGKDASEGLAVHACGAGAARHWRAKEAAMLAATAQPGLRLEVCRDFMKVRATPLEPSRDPARGPGARPARRARRRRAGVPRGGFARSNRERPSENSTSRRPAPPSATPPARHRLTPAPPRDATRQGACYRDSCRYAHSTQDGMQPAAQVRTLPTPPRGRCRPRPREGNGAARTTASVRLGFERRSATRQNRSTR